MGLLINLNSFENIDFHFVLKIHHTLVIIQKNL